MALHIASGESVVFSGSGLTALSGSSVTLSFWMRYEGYNDPGGGAVSYIFRHEGATNGYFRLGVARVGAQPLQLQFQMATSAGSGFSANYSGALLGSLLDGRWHHVVQTMGSDQLARVYMDGVRLVQSGTFRTLGFTGSVTTTVGGNGVNRWYQLADIRYYQRVLSQGEIESLSRGVDVQGGPRWLVGTDLVGVDFGGFGCDLAASGTSDGFQSCEDPPLVLANYRILRRRRLSDGRLAAAPVVGGSPHYYLRRRHVTGGRGL